MREIADTVNARKGEAEAMDVLRRIVYTLEGYDGVIAEPHRRFIDEVRLAWVMCRPVLIERVFLVVAGRA